MEHSSEEHLQIRIHGSPELPTLIYLPGLHGDWTLVASFRTQLAGKIRFVEFTYPRTTTWTLDDYARAILEALQENDITSGWLLGESFGSQIVWATLDLISRSERFSNLLPMGSILAGGFITHPRKWAVLLAWLILAKTPKPLLKPWFWIYRKYARIRHRHAPETLAVVNEFLARRTELDRQAILHRLRLIERADFRGLTNSLRIPVFYLTGLVDPIVPWASVGPQFKRYCRSLKARKMIWRADHNVLGSAPGQSAAAILNWIELYSKTKAGTNSALSSR